MRQYLGLVIGLLVGIAGAILFQQSLPPEEGSVEERLEVTEMELQKAQRRLMAFEADGRGSRKGRTVRDGMRSIAERIRDGEEVSLDDVFWTMKPWMRDMSPLFERMREVDEENRFDSLVGNYTRKYNLSERDQKELKDWFRMRGGENARELRDVIASDTSSFVDFIKASEVNLADEDGIENFMETRLQGEELAQFKAERLEERVGSVQDEANRRLHRLDGVVDLDEGQKDEMFAVMARSSQRFKPEMEFDGMGGDTSHLEGRARDEAIRGVLRPEQVTQYEAYREERKRDAEREMRRVGLTLPKDWDLLDDRGF